MDALISFPPFLSSLIHITSLSISPGPEVTKLPIPSILVMVWSSRPSPSGPLRGRVGAKGGRRKGRQRLQQGLGWLCHFRSEPSQGRHREGRCWDPQIVQHRLLRGHRIPAESMLTRERPLWVPVPLPLCTPQWSQLPWKMSEHPSPLAAHPPSHVFFKVQPMPLRLGHPARNPNWPGGGTLYFLSQFW